MDDKKKSYLDGEYLEAYNKAERYVKLYSNYRETINGNDCLIEIQDVLLIAQQDEKPINEVIGDDFNKFIRNVYRAYYPFSLVNYVYTTHTFSLFIALVMVLIFSVIKSPNEDAFTYSNVYFVSVMSTLFGDLIKWIVVKLANKVDFIFNFITKRLVTTMLNNFSMLLFIILVPNVFVTFAIETLVVVLIFILTSTIGIVYTIRMNNAHHDKVGIGTFKEALFKNMDNKYEKKNRKLVEKNKNPLTHLGWAELLEKHYKIYDVVTSLVIILYLGLTSYVIYLQVEDGFSVGGVFLLIFLVLITVFLMSYYTSKKTINEYIKSKREFDAKK